MSERAAPNLAKWPFLLGDSLLLVAAWLIYAESPRPIGSWHIGWAVLCVGGGACLSAAPFLLEYWALARRAGAGRPTVSVEQLRALESVAEQLSGAARLWQSMPEAARKAAAFSPGTAADGGNTLQEVRESRPVLGESEIAGLQSEVDKLRRLEADWLQVLVRVLDHVYALHVGALESGQPELVAQLSDFQEACREATRGIGLNPFVVEPGERFDAQRHQQADAEDPPPEAVVAETIATGYTFQGRVLRPALVRLAGGAGGEKPPEG